MPKYDPFGREVGEDTLEGLGGGARPSGRETEPEPGRPTITLPTQPRPGKPRRRWGTAVVLVVLVLFVAPLGLAALALFSAVDEVTDSVRDGLRSVPTAGPSTPQGLEAGSLVRRDRFAAALERLRGEEAGRLTSLRVAPDRIAAQVLIAGGRLRSLQLRAGGAPQILGTSGAGFGSVGTIPWARVRPAAPERLTRRAARRLGKSPRQIDYLALTGAGGGRLIWGAFFQGGGHVQGFADGRVWRRVS